MEQRWKRFILLNWTTPRCDLLLNGCGNQINYELQIPCISFTFHSMAACAAISSAPPGDSRLEKEVECSFVWWSTRERNANIAALCTIIGVIRFTGGGFILRINQWMPRINGEIENYWKQSKQIENDWFGTRKCVCGYDARCTATLCWIVFDSFAGTVSLCSIVHSSCFLFWWDLFFIIITFSVTHLDEEFAHTIEASDCQYTCNKEGRL